MNDRAGYCRYWVSLLLVVVLGACSSVRFEGTESRLRIDPGDLMNSAEVLPTGTVVWGGRIIETVNFDDSTEMLVLALPLNTGNVPRIEQNSVGRFVVRVPGYLEPLDYAPGRYVSLAGSLAGWTGAWRSDGVAVELPLVHSGQVHLWPRDQSTWYQRLNIGVFLSVHH